MSLADGLNQGFNMALSIAKFQSDQEDKELEKAYLESRIEYTNNLAERMDVEIANLVSDQKRRRLADQGLSPSQSVAKLGKTLDDFASLEKNFEGNKDNPSYKFQRDVLYRSLSTLNQTLPIVETIDPDMNKARGIVNQKLKSGDFESLVTENINSLNLLSQRQLKDLSGSKYVDPDGREGIIKKVNLTSNFIGVDEGNALLGVTAEVDFGDGDIKTIGSDNPLLIPEKNKDGARIFRNDLPSSDAQAVSVADLVDYISSESYFATELQKNPAVLSGLKQFYEIEKSAQADKNEGGFAKSFDDYLKRDYDFKSSNYFSFLAASGLVDSKTQIDTTSDEAVDSLMKKANFFFPYLPKGELVTVGDETFLKPPKGADGNTMSIEEYIQMAAPSLEDSRNAVLSVFGRNPPPLEDGDLVLGGEVIKKEGSVEDILNTINLIAKKNVTIDAVAFEQFMTAMEPYYDDEETNKKTPQQIYDEYKIWLKEEK